MPESTSYPRRTSRWLAALALTLGASSLMAAELIPFSASYAADMKSIPVNGEANHSLVSNEDGTWTLNFNAGMFVARLTEQSTLRLEEDRVIPLTYKYVAARPRKPLTGPMNKSLACTRKIPSACQPNQACWIKPPTSWRCSAI